MIIGSGNIAQLFNTFSNNEDIIIFASGVSNSLENDNKEFTREILLLKDILQNMSSKQKIVYFSTLNVFDPVLQNNLYVLHKKQIEMLIPQYTSKYFIFRVPVLFIKSKNPHLLINYFIYHIKNKLEFVVFKNAYRYFIHSDDLFLMIKEWLNVYSEKYGIWNVALFDVPFSVVNVVQMIEEMLGIKGIYELVEKGCYYKVQNDFLEIANRYFSHILKQKQEQYIYSSIQKILHNGTF